MCDTEAKMPTIRKTMKTISMHAMTGLVGQISLYATNISLINLLLALLNVFPIHLKLKLKYFPVRMLTCLSRLYWQDTSHHKISILLFHGGDLVSLITFEGTILDQAVSCFSAKNLPLVFQSVIYLYFKNVRGK